jgi:hypothetical protein
MNRLRFETRFFRRSLHKLRGVRQIKVDQLAAIVTNCVIVAVGLTIVAAGAISKFDFKHEPGFLQIAQRVVNGGITDTGQAPLSGDKDVAGSRVVVSLLNNLKNRLPLGRQLGFLLGNSHDGFRLILIQGFVNQSWVEVPGARSASIFVIRGQYGMLPGEVNNLVDVAAEWRTVDAVRREELLRLSCVVELPHEEVRNGVMRQPAYRWRGR